MTPNTAKPTYRQVFQILGLLAGSPIPPTAAVACSGTPAPAPAPNVTSPKKYTIDELRLELPRNWSGSWGGLDDETNNRYARFEADLERPGQLELEVRVDEMRLRQGFA
ncbi:hypothetical protein ABE473_00880 [Stenotrophomonas sp. TWI700]|uniref:hypothetical protein n=1 Tax=Stenotrophomonas sp. TWI700 TaxID=3136792 RepID=UPI003208D962